MGSFAIDGAWRVEVELSAWPRPAKGASAGSSTFLLASYLSAASKPSIVGFSLLAGVAVLVAREEPLRDLTDFPKGPFSSACLRWPLALG